MEQETGTVGKLQSLIRLYDEGYRSAVVDRAVELISSDLVASFEVVEEWSQPDRGYVRIRMQLTNDDFRGCRVLCRLGQDLRHCMYEAEKSLR